MSTTFPTTITQEWLLEWLSGPGLGTIRTIAVEEIGRDPFLTPSPTTADSCGAIMLLMACNGQSAETIRAWLHAQPEARAYRHEPQGDE